MIDLVKVKHYIEGKSPLSFKYNEAAEQHHYSDQYVEFWLSDSRFSCILYAGSGDDTKSVQYKLSDVHPDDLCFIAQIRLICEMKSDKHKQLQYKLEEYQIDCMLTKLLELE